MTVSFALFVGEPSGTKSTSNSGASTSRVGNPISSSKAAQMSTGDGGDEPPDEKPIEKGKSAHEMEADGNKVLTN